MCITPLAIYPGLSNFNTYFAPKLPSSIVNARSVNIDRIDQGYTSIVELINNLAYQQMIFRVIDINKDLVHNVQLRADMQLSGGDVNVITQLDQTIDDLKD